MSSSDHHWIWLSTGVLIGSFFDKVTLVGMIILWMIIHDYPLPDFLGGHPTQQLLRQTLQVVYSQAVKKYEKNQT